MIPVLRLLRDIAVRLVVIFLAVSLFSFVSLDRPILRYLYDVVDSFQAFVFDIVALWGPRSEAVLRAYSRSMLLLGSAMVVALLIGVPLGILAGMRPGSLLARAVSGISYLGILTPSFLFGLAVLVFFIFYVRRYTGVQFIILRPQDTFDIRQLLAPAITLAARPIAHLTQVTATSLAEQLREDYVRTARSKGLSARRVLWAHTWPNVVVRILDAFSASLLFSLSSLAIVEFIFSWSGVGLRLLNSIIERDAVMTSFLLGSIGFTLVFVNLGVEWAGRWLDPRLRSLETSAL